MSLGKKSFLFKINFFLLRLSRRGTSKRFNRKHKIWETELFYLCICTISTRVSCTTTRFNKNSRFKKRHFGRKIFSSWYRFYKKNPTKEKVNKRPWYKKTAKTLKEKTSLSKKWIKGHFSRPSLLRPLRLLFTYSQRGSPTKIWDIRWMARKPQKERLEL